MKSGSKYVSSRTLLHVAGLLITFAVLAALFKALRRDGPAALHAWHNADVKFAWIFVAIVCGLVGHALNVIGWKRLLNDCDVRVSFLQTARFFVLGNLGKYLPGGKAWQLGIIGIMATEMGFPPATIAASALFTGVVGIGVGVLLFLITAGESMGVSFMWTVLGCVGLGVLLLLPLFLERVPRVAAVVAKRMPAIASVNVRTMWALIWTAATSWIAWGLGLYAMGLALLPNPGASIASYISAWIGPMVLGILAFVAPAGLGVREEAMRTMLTHAGVAAGGAILVMLIARIWVTALDILPAIAFVRVGRSKRAAI